MDGARLDGRAKSPRGRDAASSLASPGRAGRPLLPRERPAACGVRRAGADGRPADGGRPSVRVPLLGRTRARRRRDGPGPARSPAVGVAHRRAAPRRARLRRPGDPIRPGSSRDRPRRRTRHARDGTGGRDRALGRADRGPRRGVDRPRRGAVERGARGPARGARPGRPARRGGRPGVDRRDACRRPAAPRRARRLRLRLAAPVPRRPRAGGAAPARRISRRPRRARRAGGRDGSSA